MLTIRRAPPPPPPSCLVDPYWNNVMLFLNGEGSNGSTPVDLSKNGYTATLDNGVNWNDATVTTSEKRFGNGSLSFPNDNTNIRFNVNEGGNGINIAQDEELTIDFWIRLSAIPTGRDAGVVGPNDDDANKFIINITNGGGLSVSLGTTSIGDFSQIMTVEAWTHLAFVRELVDPTNENPGFRGTIAMYVNGTRIGTAQSTGLNAITTPGINVGRPPLGVSGTFDGIRGHIDEFRITKGVARYTGASFTLPAAPSCIGA